MIFNLFHVQFISLSIRVSRCLHFPTKYACIIYTTLSLFTCGGHLGNFQNSANMRCASINTGVHGSLECDDFSSLEKKTRTSTVG